jgi:hypothetical protein
MSNGTFDFNEFIRESKDVLVNPKSYFSTMKTTGGIPEPLIKALIYGAISGVFSFLWSLLHIGVASNPIFGSAVGIMLLIGAIIGAVIGLFIGGVVTLILSAICKGSTDFEANLRVTAALMVIMPITSFLAFAGSFNIYLGLVVTLAVDLYALWLLYNGLVEALKAKPETSKILVYVLIGIMVLFLLVGFGTKRAANQFMKGFDNTDFKEMLNDTTKN